MKWGLLILMVVSLCLTLNLISITLVSIVPTVDFYTLRQIYDRHIWVNGSLLICLHVVIATILLRRTLSD